MTRWTINKAATEFGLSRGNLTKKLAAASITPGADEKFSTGEICRAVFSDSESASTQLKIEQAELTRVRKLELAKKLCVLETVVQVVSKLLADVRQRVMNSSMQDHEKQSLLNELQEIQTDEYFSTDAPSPEIGDEADA